MSREEKYHFFSSDTKKQVQSLKKEMLLEQLQKMLLIRHFETYGEMAYGQGKIGGFFHSYVGQEAVQTACVAAMGKKNWYTSTYRCHALALLLGATANEVMAELYGKVTGNVGGRGGSMHLFLDNMLGGHGIVGGGISIATGAAFSLKYKGVKDKVSISFFGDGAVAAGTFHECLNIASLWDLPCIYVIENNQWGMGTSVQDAQCIVPIAENKGPAYRVEAITLDGMDFFNCFAGFSYAYEQVKKNSRPILIEAVCQRFRGHSMFDQQPYRTKEELQEIMKRDPLVLMKKKLMEEQILDDEQYKELEQQQKQVVENSMKFAEGSKDPSPIDLEEDVLASEDEEK